MDSDSDSDRHRVKARRRDSIARLGAPREQAMREEEGKSGLVVAGPFPDAPSRGAPSQGGLYLATGAGPGRTS